MNFATFPTGPDLGQRARRGVELIDWHHPHLGRPPLSCQSAVSLGALAGRSAPFVPELERRQPGPASECRHQFTGNSQIRLVGGRACGPADRRAHKSQARHHNAAQSIIIWPGCARGARSDVDGENRSPSTQPTPAPFQLSQGPVAAWRARSTSNRRAELQHSRARCCLARAHRVSGGRGPLSWRTARSGQCRALIGSERN